MICPSCGAENADDAAFCAKCGAKNAKNADFCEKCGSRIKEPQNESTNLPKDKRMAVIGNANASDVLTASLLVSSVGAIFAMIGCWIADCGYWQLGFVFWALAACSVWLCCGPQDSKRQ